MATELNENDYYEKIAGIEGVSVVQYSAPWCGPCKFLAPRLQELEDEGLFTYFKVNVDDNGELARDFTIMSVPTLIFYKDSQVKLTLIGIKTRQELEAAVASL